jgi:hypothetical protein
MTDSVWISDVLADPDLVLLMETDVVAQDATRAIEASNLLKAGKAVPEGFCPKEVWAGEAAEWVQRAPDLFLANTYPIVSEKAADVLRRFDVGEGALVSGRLGEALGEAGLRKAFRLSRCRIV